MGAAGVGKRSADAESQGGEVDECMRSRAPAPSRPTAYDMSTSAVCVKCKALWLGLGLGQGHSKNDEHGCTSDGSRMASRG